MIGHTPLLKMRRDGVLPSDSVFLIDGDGDLAVESARQWHVIPNALDGLLVPHVLVEDADVPERLDLRFCIGLSVQLRPMRDADRAQRLFQAIRAAQPATLTCVMPEHIWFFSKEQGGNGKRIHA